MNWQILESDEQLTAIKEESKTQPVVIFKHSTRCSISAASLSRLERKWSAEEMQGLKTYYLDLIRYREVSNKISQEFGVRHESPQLLVIQNEKSVYNESHFGIDYDDLKSTILDS